jgi:hypothetical protein
VETAELKTGLVLQVVDGGPGVPVKAQSPVHRDRNRVVEREENKPVQTPVHGVLVSTALVQHPNLAETAGLRHVLATAANGPIGEPAQGKEIVHPKQPAVVLQVGLNFVMQVVAGVDVPAHTSVPPDRLAAFQVNNLPVLQMPKVVVSGDLQPLVNAGVQIANVANLQPPPVMFVRMVSSPRRIPVGTNQPTKSVLVGAAKIRQLVHREAVHRDKNGIVEREENKPAQTPVHGELVSTVLAQHLSLAEIVGLRHVLATTANGPIGESAQGKEIVHPKQPAVVLQVGLNFVMQAVVGVDVPAHTNVPPDKLAAFQVNSLPVLQMPKVVVSGDLQPLVNAGVQIANVVNLQPPPVMFVRMVSSPRRIPVGTNRPINVVVVAVETPVIVPSLFAQLTNTIVTAVVSIVAIALDAR